MCNKTLFIFIVSMLSASLSYAEPAPIWETGQTKCYNAAGAEIACRNTAQDGEVRAGVAWPNPRFTVDGDCVTDNLTGLMWPKNANLPNGTKDWFQALDFIGNLSLCRYADWRLPNRKELFSLIDYARSQPALQEGNPFINVQSEYYWSSTTYASATNSSWFVNIWYGFVHHYFKPFQGYVWPVRAGQKTIQKN